MDTVNLKVALHWAKLGWKVFPAHWDGTSHIDLCLLSEKTLLD